MVAQRAGLFDQVQAILTEALRCVAPFFPLGKKPFLAAAKNHIHARSDELVYDLGVILTISDTGYEASRARLHRTSGINQPRAQTRCDGLLHDTGPLARSRNRSSLFFSIRAEGIGANFPTISMGGGAAIGGRGERVGHVPTINGNRRDPVPVQIRIRPRPEKSRRLPV